MIPRIAEAIAASADDLIQLPRFDAVGAVAVGDLLLAAATRELPRSIARARDALAVELNALAKALLQPLFSWKSSTLGRSLGETTLY